MTTLPVTPQASFARILWSALLAGLSLASVHAQVRPPGGGGSATPTIATAPGALVGEPQGATVTVGPAAPGGNPGAGQALMGATYQWTVTGARILNDPRAAAIQYVAESTGTVTLAVTITAGGQTYSPTATVTVLSAQTAGTITTPATVAADATSVTASVPQAQGGDRTFRWSVGGGGTLLSGQGTNAITYRPGNAGLKQVVCNVNLQNLVTVPVRAYVVTTGTGEAVAVTVNAGSGGGSHRAGSRVDVLADPPPAGQVFDRWTGDVALLGNNPLAPFISRGAITVPTTPVTLTATYKPAPAWTLRTLAGFNPQSQPGPNNTTTTVTTTLNYHVPANPAGLVFLLHEPATSGSSWFERPNQLLLCRELVAAGYGVAALDSLNRTTGIWGPQPTLAANLDALNHAAALSRLVADGALAATTPVFFLGNAAGSGAAVRFADLLATASPARPIKGAILFLSAGIDTLAVTSRVPQFFALAANDDTLGPTGLADARDASQILLGRGIATGLAINPVAPLSANRFRSLALTAPTFTSADAQAVWNAVKGAGYLDANNYPTTIPPLATLANALPAAYRSRTADVAAELSVAAAEREFFPDANGRILAFLAARVSGTAVPAPGRLVNISTRTSLAFVGDTLSLGFNISGTERAQLLIRGIGPALTKFGLAGALAAPRLEVNRGATVLFANEGWDKPGNTATGPQISAAAASIGAFALDPGSADAAVLVTLEPGTYTANLKGLGGTTGDVLAEIYDVSRNGTRLTNLSTLARINQEGDLLIPGIVVAGTSPRTLLIRAVSQGLRDFGIPAEAVLGDPRISVLEGSQTVDTNNNWVQTNQAMLAAAFPAVGAFALRNQSDAALVNPLAPGSYTLQAGAAPLPVQPPANFVPPNLTGSVLVEVYELP